MLISKMVISKIVISKIKISTIRPFPFLGVSGSIAPQWGQSRGQCARLADETVPVYTRLYMN